MPHSPRSFRAKKVQRLRWVDVDARQRRLARLGRERLAGPGVVLVATIRDGTPRISPVESFFRRGNLWPAMGLDTTRARDLLRDPRLLVHSIVTSRDGREGGYKVAAEPRSRPTPD